MRWDEMATSVSIELDERLEQFVERMRQGADAYRAGDPMSKTTALGPLISAQHREKVLGYYMTAAAEGARFVLGGSTPKLDAPFSGGFYVEPTLWTELPDTARVVREDQRGDARETVLRRACEAMVANHRLMVERRLVVDPSTTVDLPELLSANSTSPPSRRDER